MALQSKISQLPRKVRDELNRRLDDGQLSPEILPWLNALPEVKDLVARKFKGEVVSNQNISTWRETGFCEWQTGQRRINHTRALVETAKELGKDAGKVFAGGGAIAAGHIMELMEDLDVDTQKMLLREKPESFTELLDKLARLTKSTAEAERNQLAREKGEREKEKLGMDREKFEFTQAKAVLKHAQSKEVQDIVKGPGSNADKIAALRRRMFPQRPPTLP